MILVSQKQIFSRQPYNMAFPWTYHWKWRHPLTTLHQIAVIGSSLTAWLFCDHGSIKFSKCCFLLLTFCARLWSILIHFDPFCALWPAMWSLSTLHVLLLAHYSAPTLTTRQWRNRFKNSGISPHMYTYPFFNPNMWYKQDAISPTWPEAEVVYTQSGLFFWVQLPFQPWNVSSTGLQNWNKFGATSQFMQNCQSVTGASGQILNRTRVLFCKHAQSTTMPGSVNSC